MVNTVPLLLFQFQGFYLFYLQFLSLIFTEIVNRRNGHVDRQAAKYNKHGNDYDYPCVRA